MNNDQPSSAPFSLRNQLAVITGGGTGIGMGIASCMVQAGARVILMGRRDDILAEACAQLGEAASYRVFDITRTDQCSGLVDALIDQYGCPDILVNNAGNHLKQLARDTSDAQLQALLNVHLNGAYALTRALIPAMTERGRGHILFITSMAAVFGIPQVSAYAAAKSAQLGLVRSLATELSGQGVRVNAIAPGWIHSDMSARALNGDPQRKQKILSRTPLGKLGRPDDIGWAAVYLSSPAARFITGQQLRVDGGISIGF